MPRVVTYIDGFNLYFGLRSQGWERFLWLDVQGSVPKPAKARPDPRSYKILHLPGGPAAG